MRVTVNYSGTLFRCIPHSSSEPLSVTYSLRDGGRWNAPGTFPVLYTFLSRRTARTWYQAHLATESIRIEEVVPEKLPDLVVLNCSVTGLADLCQSAGLVEVGLPETYPVGFETRAAYPVTQNIGAKLYASGSTGIKTRSASAHAWDGPDSNWAEIALFTDYAPMPAVADRLDWSSWWEE